jgi:hypothetical protein
MRANGTFVLSEEWTDADTAIGRVSEGLDKASKGCGNGFSGAAQQRFALSSTMEVGWELGHVGDAPNSRWDNTTLS